MEIILPLLIGAGAVGGLAYLYPRMRANRHLIQLGENFPRIQQAAFDNDGLSEGITEVPDLIARQCFTTAIGFRLVYTCDRAENGDQVHHLSGQQQQPNDKRLIHNMLLVVGILLGQFAEAKIELKEGQFQVSGSELGTQHLEFTLTEREHESLRRILSPAPRQAVNPGKDPELLRRILSFTPPEATEGGKD